jgi:hypothetical protein
MEQNGFQEFVGPSESQNLMRMAWSAVRSMDSGKRQTRPLVRETAPHQHACSCLGLRLKWVLSSKTDWTTEHRS